MVQPRKDFLQMKTVKELRKIAGKLGNDRIKNYNKLRKPELVRQIHLNTRLQNGVLMVFKNKRL